MTSLGAGPTTDAPSLLVVADLGEMPPLGLVRRHIEALDDVRVLAEALMAVRSSRGANFPAPKLVDFMRAIRSRESSRPGGLRVARMRLESPFETVLTTVANEFSGVAYGVAALVTVERILRLVMEWQKHRMDMAERRAALLPPRLGGDPEGASYEIAVQVVRTALKSSTQPELSQQEIEEMLETAAEPIERLARIQLTRVESSA